MLLASIVLAAQVSGTPPARAQVAKPCADPSLLCRISPFFCPGTYPAGMEPCWPEDPRETQTLSSRPAAASGGALRRQRQSETSAPVPGARRTAEAPDRGRPQR